MDGICRIIRMILSMGQLAQYINELLPSHVNFEHQQSTVYATAFQNKMTDPAYRSGANKRRTYKECLKYMWLVCG